MPCACVDVELGTYSVAVPLHPPASLGYTRIPISVDRCIAEEVRGLWARGIVTTGSCCGHNRQPGYISVLPEHADRMLSLGYERYPHPNPADREHFFVKTEGKRRQSHFGQK